MTGHLFRMLTVLPFTAFSPGGAFAADDPPPVAEQAIVLVEPLADYVYSYGLKRQHPSTAGSTVSVIDSAAIEIRQLGFAADALREVPGVSLARNGAFGGVASARIRGGSSGQTLVVIDGVVVNDASAPQGGFNFASLDVDDIDRIEVLRGPQGLVWGADAIGGVIYIQTKDEGPSLSAYAEGGSRGTARAGAATFLKGGDRFVRATLSGVTTDGVSRAASGNEADGFRSLAASATAGAALGGADLRLIARVSDSRSEIDGFPPPTFALADTLEREDTTDFLVAATLDHHSGDAFAAALSVSWNGVDRDNDDAGVETFSAKGDRLAAAYRIDARAVGPFRLGFGAEVERTSAKVSGVDEDALAGGLYAMTEVSPFSGATVSAGVRREEFSNFKGATTARVAGVIDLWERAESATRLRASWGQGFRAPTLFELNFSQFGVIPNPNLQPERARGFDIGLEQTFGERTNLRATYFRQRVKDQIDFDFAQSGYFNIDRVKSEGVEVEADLSLSDLVGARLVYTLTDARDAITGAPILRVPKHAGSASLFLSPSEKLSLSATLVLNGKESDFPTPNEAFARLDLRAAYALTRSLSVFGRIENATDERYEDVSGYGEPGASFFAGVRLSR